MWNKLVSPLRKHSVPVTVAHLAVGPHLGTGDALPLLVSLAQHPCVVHVWQEKRTMDGKGWKLGLL
jgi:hypothetical protein